MCYATHHAGDKLEGHAFRHIYRSDPDGKKKQL